MHQLPLKARLVAESQGWNNHTVCVHLLGLMKEIGVSDARITAYLADAAKEENTALEEIEVVL